MKIQNLKFNKNQNIIGTKRSIGTILMVIILYLLLSLCLANISYGASKVIEISTAEELWNLSDTWRIQWNNNKIN